MIWHASWRASGTKALSFCDATASYVKMPTLWSLKDILADLTARFNDVTTKYKALRQNIAHQMESFRQAQQQRILMEGHEGTEYR